MKICEIKVVIGLKLGFVVEKAVDPVTRKVLALWKNALNVSSLIFLIHKVVCIVHEWFIVLVKLEPFFV